MSSQMVRREKEVKAHRLGDLVIGPASSHRLNQGREQKTKFEAENPTGDFIK